MTETRSIRVALAGNPNAGKSALFNALTGARARVANYPGTTVERKEARVQVGDRTLEVVDVPGCYSLVARSRDEEVAHDVLTGRLGGPSADVIVAVLDATNLVRNCYLAVQLAELGRPMVIALNMMDAAHDRGLEIDVATLEARFGVPVLPIVATTGEGVDALTQALLAPRAPAIAPTLDSQTTDIVTACTAALANSGQPASLGDALFYLTSGEGLRARLPTAAAAVLDDAGRQLLTHPEPFSRRLIEARYALVQTLLAGVVRQVRVRGPDRTARIDAVLTHPVGGLLLFAAAMVLVFQAVYGWSEPLIGAVEDAMGVLHSAATTRLPEGVLRELVTDGLIAGVGSVLVFVPQLVLLFFVIALLEDSGYMARAAFLLDRVMSRVGLHGKAFLPLMTSFACAIPGIAATRTVENSRDRLATMFIAPFMSCSARLPVYTLVIGAVFATSAPVFGLSFGGLVIAAMYLLGIVAALFTAWLLKRTVLAAPAPPFVMELPSYRLPSVRGVGLQVLRQTRSFLTETGPVILALSVVLWAAMTYPNTPLTDAETAAAVAAAPEDPDGATDTAASQKRLEFSVAGRVGKAIEPLIAPLGFDWKIGIGLVGSFAAREVLVSTLGQVYGAGADADEGSPVLREALLREVDPATGRSRFTPLTGLSLMVFFVLAMQCLSTVAAVRRESGGWKWAIAMVVYMNGLAWIASFATFRIGQLLGYE